MAHFSQYRKNCHRTDVGNLQRSRYGVGKLSIWRASSLLFYKWLAMSRTHDLFLVLCRKFWLPGAPATKGVFSSQNFS